MRASNRRWVGARGRISRFRPQLHLPVDAHHGQVAGAGAEIIKAPRDESFDGRNTICRDPEGHVWSFGSDDPWGS